MRVSFFLLLVLVSCSPLPAQTTGDVMMTEKSASGKLVEKWITKSAGKVIGWNGIGVLGPVDGGGGGGSGTVTSVGLSLPNIFSVTGSPITESGTLAASLATQSANRVWAGPATGTAAAPTFRALVADDLPDLRSVYQPLSSKLTAFGALANAAGVLTNDGNGVFSYSPVVALADANTADGSIVSYAFGGGINAAYISANSVGPTNPSTLVYPNQIYFNQLTVGAILQIPTLTGNRTWTMPDATGTVALTNSNVTGNTSGTAAGLSSTLAVSSGGTGQTTWTNGQIPIGNTTGNTLTKATLTAGTGISITNGNGSITIAATDSGGTVTSVAASVPSFLSVSGSPITSAGTLAITYSGIALPVANGGTGITSFGTGIATALGVNIGSAGAPVLFNGDAGTPSAIVLTNASGTALSLTVGSAARSDGLSTTGSPVSTAAAAAPSTGQVLTATDATHATWQTPSSGATAPSQATKTDTETLAASTWTDVTGLSITFTASSTTQKILLSAMIMGGNASTATAQYRIVNEDGVCLEAASTGSRIAAHGYIYANSATSMGSCPMMLVFTPGTTSARTYKVQWYRNGSGNVHINRTATDTDSSSYARTASTFILQPY